MSMYCGIITTYLYIFANKYIFLKHAVYILHPRIISYDTKTSLSMALMLKIGNLNGDAGIDL